MRDLRIVFMGTPDFAVATLRTLVTHQYHIVGVITAADKPAGRGQKIQESAVKKYAVSQGLNVLQPTNLKSDDFLNELQALQANLQIVVAFRMLPAVVWQMPEFGTFNLHASLLPNYRGAAPINWAIINGEEKTGVTTFFIDEKIDTGAMIMQEEVVITEEDNAGSLHDKLMETGAGLVLKTVEQIKNNTAVTTYQKESATLKSAYKIHKDTCKIDWTASLDEIYNFIRGMSPYPTAWSLLKNDDDSLNVKIYTVTKEKAAHTYEAGKIIADKNSAKVAVAQGFIHLEEIQLPGKRKMTIKDVLNGYQFTPNANML
ncbi:methionyl-tRNA formyltransferase [Zhouia sp. PK063]|uniref:methionyl-tRNA formyltransferase n=1 Tax=Zhouia sp. PK063 TaxID=3373602 RepID=UPI0037946123